LENQGQNNFDSLAALKTKLTPEIFLQVCQEMSVCPECLTESLTITCDDSQEVICKRCGLVISAYQETPHSLPGYGSDTHYSDVCHLSFGKSLGTELGKFQTYSILAKSEAGKQDIGKRRLIVKNLTRVEIPQVQQLLFYGSQLCKTYHLDGATERSILFADQLGRIMRTVGTVALALSQNSLGVKRLANACFVYLHRKSFNDGSDLQKNLKVEDAHLAWVEWILGSYSMPKGFEIRRKKIDTT
jgi:hypothetical protein